MNPVPSFKFLQKPETKQDFLSFLFGEETLQALIMRPQGNTGETDTERKTSETGN